MSRRSTSYLMGKYPAGEKAPRRAKSFQELSDDALVLEATAARDELIKRMALRVAMGRMSRRAGLEAVRSMGVPS